jgi:hypothetical protein
MQAFPQMYLTLRLRFASEGLRDRLQQALSTHGARSSLARVIGVSPPRITQLVNGTVDTMPLSKVLTIESHLEVDLLGGDRSGIAAELRNIADHLDPPSPLNPGDAS